MLSTPTAADLSSRRQRRRWQLRFMLAVISTGVALLTAEIVMRVWGIDFTTPYVHDPHCGVRLKPGHTFWNLSEGRVRVTTNQEGLRDREHARSKPPGTVRIAVLGDSFAEAQQVEQHAAFWSILESELNRQPVMAGQTVEVLNFGISGYGTTEALQMLRHTVWGYEPDLVLLAFFPGNDVHNNSRELEDDPGRPYFDLRDDRLVLDESFVNLPATRRFRESRWLQFKDRLICSSRVLSLLYRARDTICRRAEFQAAPASATQAAGEVGLDMLAFAPPGDGPWEYAWNLTGRILDQMAREVRERNARFLVVVLNSGQQVSPDPEVIGTLAATLGSSDLDYPDRRLREFADHSDFALITLTPPMRLRAQREQIYFHGFPNTRPGEGHWNERGHRAAGELIAEELRKRPELLMGPAVP